MHHRFPMILSLLLVSPALLADGPEPGPVIEDYGAVYAVADRDIPLRENFLYKLIFNAARYPGERSAVNVPLDTVARFINMHARNGVTLDQMDLVVVLHGDALSATLKNDAYRKRFGTDNPNLELVSRLHDAGVRFLACGQTAKFRGFARAELSPAVEIGLSAMTLFATLQADGYSLLL